MQTLKHCLILSLFYRKPGRVADDVSVQAGEAIVESCYHGLLSSELEVSSEFRRHQNLPKTPRHTERKAHLSQANAEGGDWAQFVNGVSLHQGTPAKIAGSSLQGCEVQCTGPLVQSRKDSGHTCFGPSTCHL